LGQGFFSAVPFKIVQKSAIRVPEDFFSQPLQGFAGQLQEGG
jgi:hypothetical protein